MTTFFIDAMSRVPIYEQLIHQVERQTMAGVLHGGDPLPSVRSLSVELGINPNTIQKAYSELDSRGLLVSAPGRGSFLTEDAAKILARRTQEHLSDMDDWIAELALAGVPENTVIDRVHEIYQDKRGKRHD